MDIEQIEIEKDQLIELINTYQSRENYEELSLIEKHGGEAKIIQKILSSKSFGIEEHTCDIRERLFGSNKMEEYQVPSFCSFVADAFGDFMLRVLIVAAIVQICIGVTPLLSAHPDKDWIDGVSIIFAVTAVVVISSYTNYTKETKFKTLNDQSQFMTNCTLIRDGKTYETSPNNILVGDLVKLKLGSIIHCDGILVDSRGMQVDESALTGESELIEKNNYEFCLKIKKTMIDKNIKLSKHTIPTPILISGTSVKNGEGWMVALCVGPNSCKGKIKIDVEANIEASKTPLEEKLDELAEDIGKFGMIMGVLTFVILLIRVLVYSVENNLSDSDDEDGNIEQLSPGLILTRGILSALLIGIAIIVVAIPEGLPLAVTLALAFSINKMMKDNNLVRKMKACETVGSANVICTDKTGTLTKNEMELVSIFNNCNIIQLGNLQESSKKLIMIEDFFDSNYFKILSDNLCLNIDAEIDEQENYVNESKTDKAFIDFLHSFGRNIFTSRVKYNNKKIITFNSQRKKMTVLVKHKDFPLGARAIIKGASEVVLNSSDYYLNPESSIVERINDEKKELFDSVIKQFADESLRTIYLAYKDITEEEFDNICESEDNLSNYNSYEEDNLILIGLFGIKDALKAGISDAINSCNKAGINVIMVTGDNIDTATAIAKECNILDKTYISDIKNNSVMLGVDFYQRTGGLHCANCEMDNDKCECPKTIQEAMNQDKREENVRKLKVKDLKAFEEITIDLKVLARSRPIDKLLLVSGLMELNQVVAVTGDGTNDAQALSKSDVGFAMGIQGTDIAKDAADIIILDDNFASIVGSVKWGRGIYENIRKFIQFQLSINLSACLLVLISTTIGNETPISVIQMLWLNLIMDTLGSLALATELPSDDLLLRKPVPRGEYIINLRMWKHIVIQALFCLMISLILYIQGPYFIKEENLNRIDQAMLISKCYGAYPGLPPINDDYYIISGNHLDWPSTVNLQDNSIDCKSYQKYGDMSLALIHYKSMNGNTPHLTIVFNVFTLYSILNMANSRILDDDFNILKGILKSSIFIIIFIIEIVLQIVIVQVGGNVFNSCHNGLTFNQWLICISLSCLTFPLSVLIKLIPIERIVNYVKGRYENKDEANYSVLSNEEKIN